MENGDVKFQSSVYSMDIKVKSNIDSGQFKPMMLAAVKALQAKPEFHQQMNDIYKKRRTVAEQMMKTLDCIFDPKQSGMFLWGKIPAKYSGSEELANKVLYDANVFLTPGFIFGSNGERYIRISLCCKEELLQEALNRIKNIGTR